MKEYIQETPISSQYHCKCYGNSNTDYSACNENKVMEISIFVSLNDSTFFQSHINISPVR